jgi:N-acetyl-gamma-glutamyl-phosphate reductase
MPELHKTEIKKAQLVANPGCYPTASILSVAPLLAAKLVKPGGIVIDAKSGVSGAGRKLTVDIHYSEMDENLLAYKAGGVHQHIPEMEQEMSAVAGGKVTISFTPHLVPLNRGIFATVYASLKRNMTLGKLVSLYQCFYRDAAFVRVYPAGKIPAQKAVAGTNYCDIGLAMDARTGRAVIISAIDNLGKGAAGQAVHNMNLMCGFPETEGLLGAGLYP